MGLSECCCLPAHEGHDAQNLEPQNTDKAIVAVMEVDMDPSEVN